MTLTEIGKKYRLVRSVSLHTESRTASVVLLRSRKNKMQLFTAVCFENGEYTEPVRATPRAIRLARGAA